MSVVVTGIGELTTNGPDGLLTDAALVLDGLGPNGPYHVVPVERSTLLQLGFAYALLDRFETIVGGRCPGRIAGA